MASQSASLPFTQIFLATFQEGFGVQIHWKIMWLSKEVHSVFIFETFEDISLALDGLVVVTFYLPLTVHNKYSIIFCKI